MGSSGGHGGGGNVSRREFHAIEPLRPLERFVYRCDSHFQTEPLRAQLADTRTYGFVIIDGSEAVLAAVSGRRCEILHSYRVQLPPKHRAGGQSSVRFARLRLEARHNYVTKTAEAATKYFIDPTTARPRYTGLILAGPASFKTVLREALDPRLQAQVLGVYDTQYSGRAGLQEAMKAASQLLDSVLLVQQQKILQRFYEAIARNSDTYSFGVRDTIDALEQGAVEICLIAEDCQLVRRIFEPAADAATDSADDERPLVRVQTPDTQARPDKESGLKCIEETLLLDWLVEHHQEFGCKLEILSANIPEGAQFANGFGGFGAILRYPLHFADPDGNEDDNESSFSWDADGSEW